jgi:hypothetical protein
MVLCCVDAPASVESFSLSYAKSRIDTYSFVALFSTADDAALLEVTKDSS